MDSPSEKYPALARALDKKILDGEGNELTTEAAIEMLHLLGRVFSPRPSHPYVNGSRTRTRAYANEQASYDGLRVSPRACIRRTSE